MSPDRGRQRKTEARKAAFLKKRRKNFLESGSVALARETLATQINKSFLLLF
jgi:hypothetical protein